MIAAKPFNQQQRRQQQRGQREQQQQQQQQHQIQAKDWEVASNKMWKYRLKLAGWFLMFDASCAFNCCPVVSDIFLRLDNNTPGTYAKEQTPCGIGIGLKFTVAKHSKNNQSSEF